MFQAHAQHVEVGCRQVGFAAHRRVFGAAGRQAGAQVVDEALQHAPGLGGLTVDQADHVGQGVVEEVRLDLGLQGAQARLGDQPAGGGDLFLLARGIRFAPHAAFARRQHQHDQHRGQHAEGEQDGHDLPALDKEQRVPAMQQGVTDRDAGHAGHADRQQLRTAEEHGLLARHAALDELQCAVDQEADQVADHGRVEQHAPERDVRAAEHFLHHGQAQADQAAPDRRIGDIAGRRRGPAPEQGDEFQRMAADALCRFVGGYHADKKLP